MSKNHQTSLHSSDLNSLATPIPFLRTAYDGLSDIVSFQTGLSCPEPTLAQQSFAEEAEQE